MSLWGHRHLIILPQVPCLFWGVPQWLVPGPLLEGGTPVPGKGGIPRTWQSPVKLTILVLFNLMARSHTRRRVRIRIPVPGDISMATVAQCRKLTLDQKRDRYPSLIGYSSHFRDRSPSPGEVSVYVNEPLHCCFVHKINRWKLTTQIFGKK